jgi:serine/threonine-protein kinase
MAEQDLVNKTVAGRYRVERLIARGGMASVYLAEDTRLERPCALKVIYSHLAEDPKFRAKFTREAKVAARVSHPNLVNVFDQGEDNGVIFLAMEYVPGMTLRDAMNKFGALSPARTLELFEPIIQGLAAAHAAGILHRDIKPENVFLSDNGKVKLGDFGLARGIDANTQTGSLIGTVAYLSPELITRGATDARSDIYAAGIMLFEMLTGTQPFKGNEAAHIAHQHTMATMPKPSSVYNGVPPLLDEVVLWTTSKNPEHRPKNAMVLLEVIHRVTEEIRAGRGATTRLNIPVDSMGNPTKVFANGINIPDGPDFIPADTSVLGTGYGSGANREIPPGAQDTTVLSKAKPVVSKLNVVAQSRKGRAKLATFLVFASTLAFAGAGWWFGAGPGAISPIPELQNRTVEQAQTALAPFDAQIEVQTENSPTIAKDLVIRTFPESGSFFWRGNKVIIFKSLGPKSIQVPDLSGLHLERASAVLHNANLNVGTIEYVISKSQSGTIVDYTGKGDGEVLEGSKINLTISFGKLPNVEGKSQTDAIKVIEDLGLKIDKVSKEFSDTVENQKAISVVALEDPLKKGGSVELIVSKGKNVVAMPNVVGETILAAQSILIDLGLQVMIDTNQPGSKWGIAVVKSTSVSTGTQLKMGDSVTLISR